MLALDREKWSETCLLKCSQRQWTENDEKEEEGNINFIDDRT